MHTLVFFILHRSHAFHTLLGLPSTESELPLEALDRFDILFVEVVVEILGNLLAILDFESRPGDEGEKVIMLMFLSGYPDNYKYRWIFVVLVPLGSLRSPRSFGVKSTVTGKLYHTSKT